MTNQEFVNAVRAGYPKLIVPAKAPRSYYSKVFKLLKSCNITVDDASVIGKWLAKQTWIKSPITLIACANKAGEWLAKAQAETGSFKAAPRTRKDDDWVTEVSSDLPG